MDGTGTIASTTRLKDQAEEAAKAEADSAGDSGAAANLPANDAAPINEELFMGLEDELGDFSDDDDDDDEDDED